MSPLWRRIWPCYAFTLPMTLVGMLLAAIFYRAFDWRWSNGVLTCLASVGENGSTRIWGKPNAQTFGWLQIYDNEASRGQPDLRVHETVHVGQAFFCSLVGVLAGVYWGPTGAALGGLCGGLGFAILYGLAFGFLLLTRQGWYDAYLTNPFEAQAYRIQDRYLDLINGGHSPLMWGVTNE